LLISSVAALAAGGVGLAAASIPGAGGQIDGCYSKVGGVLRAIDKQAGQACSSKLEVPISWNQTGPKGAPGSAGPPGPKGAPGDTGAAGAPGEDGAPGTKGDPGEKGEPGAKGDTGAAGVPGENGAPGAKGDPGEKGETGAKGDKGEIGPRGEPGPPLESFDDLDDLPCRRNGRDGQIDLTYAANGAATFTCVLPAGPPPACVDDPWPNTAGGAFALGALSGDSGTQSSRINGSSCAVDDEDWFRITLTENNFAAFTPVDLSVSVNLTSLAGDSDVCLYTAAVVQIACSTNGGTLDSIRHVIPDTGGDDTTTLFVKVVPFTVGSYELGVVGNT
jgi:hypothetical protein